MKTECSWTMVLEFRVKQRVGWIKKNLVRVTVTFWCLSIREPGKIVDTNMARDFDRIHKSVRWPCTYDNTGYSWRTRLTVRPQDFHSWNSSSILLCATNKKVEILFQLLEICGGVKRIGTPEIWMFKNHLRLITSR